jgi:eukaryotic-like serine/threonine-protein kinase
MGGIMAPSQPQPQQQRVDKETFVERVRASGLISPERLEKALQQIAPTDRGKPVARGLVQQGQLTKFQAERLLAGKIDGFTMGQYRILDEIGRGGMGQVFKAEHMTMGRLVALKILNNNLVKTERARQLFHREVKAAAKLSHPNIVTAFDANQIGERCFLVMEFVDGPNLHDLVKEHGPLPLAQACDYIRQAALGLNYAHDIGMVHRDIKPANLLVQKNTSKSGTSSSVVKILDFGLARISSSENGSPESDSIEVNAKTVMGTPDYLSPEQARCLHSVDGRADIYSLGCTLHCLLTGQVPFPGGTTMEKLVRHSTEPAPLANTLRPDVPPELAAIVATMMAKKPEDRFQSGADVAMALLPFSSGQETANWIAVEPFPAESVMPVSTRSLPRLAVDHENQDPFANLDDTPADLSEGEVGNDIESVGTLSGEGAMTDFASSTKLRRAQQGGKKKKKDSMMLWVVILLIAILGLAAGVFFVARAMMKAM